MKKYLLLIIISIIAIGSFIFSYRTTTTSAACPGTNCWAGAIDCGSECCNCYGGSDKCCYYGCETTCTPVCSCVTRTATTATIPFTYTRGCCGANVTKTTLPFTTEVGTYYTLPVTYSYNSQ